MTGKTDPHSPRSFLPGVLNAFVIGFESPAQINELLDDTRVALADLAKTGAQTA